MTSGLWLFAGALAYLACLSVVFALLYAHGEREAEAEAAQVNMEGQP